MKLSKHTIAIQQTNATNFLTNTTTLIHKRQTQLTFSQKTQKTIATPSPPIESFDFRGFDSSKLLILRGGNLMSVELDRGSPGKFDSRTLNRKTLNRWTGRNTQR